MSSHCLPHGRHDLIDGAFDGLARVGDVIPHERRKWWLGLREKQVLARIAKLLEIKTSDIVRSEALDGDHLALLICLRILSGAEDSPYDPRRKNMVLRAYALLLLWLIPPFDKKSAMLIQFGRSRPHAVQLCLSTTSAMQTCYSEIEFYCEGFQMSSRTASTNKSQTTIGNAGSKESARGCWDKK